MTHCLQQCLYKATTHCSVSLNWGCHQLLTGIPHESVPPTVPNDCSWSLPSASVPPWTLPRLLIGFRAKAPLRTAAWTPQPQNSRGSCQSGLSVSLSSYGPFHLGASAHVISELDNLFRISLLSSSDLLYGQFLHHLLRKNFPGLLSHNSIHTTWHLFVWLALYNLWLLFDQGLYLFLFIIWIPTIKIYIFI